MTTNVPSLIIDSTGVKTPTETEILAGIQQDFNAAFGGNLNPSLETPQGELASSFAKIIADKNAQIAYLANMFDPTLSEGRWQDAIGKIYFLTRLPATGTTVQATCSGLDGTVIPVGARAKNSTTGDTYTCTVGGTISSGSALCSFECDTTGSRSCPIGSLDTIYQRIAGWDSVSNSAAGTTGRDVESRAAFEDRRRNSVALNAAGYIQSIQAAVRQVDGVVSVYIKDNNTASAITVGGVTIAANSVYIAVRGGIDEDIAKAIYSRMPLTAAYSAGTVTVTVNDTTYPVFAVYYDNSTIPPTPVYVAQPSYTVTFTRPSLVAIYFKVNISTNINLPSDINTKIQQAILDTASGDNGAIPLQIGYSVFASQFYKYINAIDPSVNVVSIKVGTTSTPTADTVTLNLNQYPQIFSYNIAVVQV